MPSRLAGPLTGDLESDIAVVILVVALALALRLLDKNLATTGRFGAAAIGIGLVSVALALFIDTNRTITSPYLNAPIDPARAQTGRAIYAENCLRCHGETGRGNGPDAMRLSIMPMDLTTHIFQHDEVYLYDLIRVGRGAMPGFRDTLTQTQIGDVIHYVRALAKKGQ